MGKILPFLLVLLVIAFFTRVDHFFYLFYALSGIYILGRLWARRSLGSVEVHRSHDRRVFLGQPFTVEIQVQNRSWLPVLWLRLGDSVPAELAAGSVYRRVISLLPRERLDLGYTLNGRRRGYYPIGPLITVGGDLLGTANYEHRYDEDDHVIVYPKIVALRALGFPSQSPSGNLPSRERLFEDPSRIRGVRTYQPGDPLKRIDWKTSARLGTLQVRRYEPAIALETAIFLNLDGGDYSVEQRYLSTELGIVVAASVAVHVVEKRQAVGLFSNGQDPLRVAAPESGQVPPPALPLRKGREHLMHVLDLLARIRVAAKDEAVAYLDLLSRQSLGLPWGSTVVAVTAQEVEGLMDTLLALRRRGLVVILVTTCPDRAFALTAQRADQIGVQAHRIWHEQDLDVWR
jgi:uncharacterized protein (DUF58 family)